MRFKTSRLRKGFSLVEVLVGAFLFTIIASSVFQSYVSILDANRTSRVKQNAIALANEQLEIVRNMEYIDVGIVGGLPEGVIPRAQDLTRSNLEFTVTTTIRSIDDPFDGTMGGTPNDLSPGDYKLVEIMVSPKYDPSFTPVVITTNVMPKNLETAQNNGALFIEVFDANGQPIEQATVHIENDQTTTTLVIDEETNNEGKLQIVDAPPGIEAYKIRVTKAGYSTDRTYAPEDISSSTPVLSHATVALQQVTAVSFAIDQLSTLNISTKTKTCSGIPNVDYSIQGSKLIGTDPSVYKYSENKTTDYNGDSILSSIEWDAYTITLNDASYDLVGTIPSASIALSPNSTQDLKLIVNTRMPSTLLVNVKDAGTKLPLSSAYINLGLSGVTTTKTTGIGFLQQTNWGGGSGQDGLIADDTKYYQGANIETNDPVGEIKLTETAGSYDSSGWLESSIFDIGETATLQNIVWIPVSQPQATGDTPIKIQIAAATSTTSTFEFLGPDGTNGTYYTASNSTINASDGRYFKYKVFLQTASTTYTPNLAELSFTFTSDCTPPGQAAYQNLSTGSYDLEVTKTGYQSYIDLINITEDWQEIEILMQPE